MSLNISMIGSCLSASTLEVLLRKTPHTAGSVFRHLRSDAICDILGGDFVGAPKDMLPRIAALLKPRIRTEIDQHRMVTRLKLQSQEDLNQLPDNLRQADVLLLDTNYDFGRLRQELTLEGETYKFCNLGAGKAEDCKLLPALSPEEIAASVKTLFDMLADINPNLRIFFINYPISAFANRGTKNDLDRVAGVRALSQSLRAQAQDGALPAGLTVIDCVDLPEHLLDTKKGPLYFENPVYDTFSELIARKLDPDTAPQGQYFDDFDALRATLGMDPVPAPQAPTTPAPATPAPAAASPYTGLPDRQYWKPAVADPYPLAITDLYHKRYEIDDSARIATCGSCFAQHIGKRMNKRGFAYMDMEPTPPGMPASEATAKGYGIYSARYGNVYTSRQLLQMFNRAFGTETYDELWQNEDGRYVDPFRPNLCAGGSPDMDTVRAEQAEHLAQVRRMFEELDVFVFTMGLTETWANRKTGAVYPLCPGVTAGTFDPDLHEFINLDYATILTEMEQFLAALAKVNPTARVLITVSPVPLTATAEDRHVLVSTMASKAILRAVADTLYRRQDHVDYFPSYDIVMSPPYKAMFFKNNLRSIHEEGVDYIMSHFFRQHTVGADRQTAPPPEPEDDEVFCDEAFLELARTTGS